MKGLPFTIHIFIGPNEKSAGRSSHAPSSTHAGSVYNFSAPSHTTKGSCANCERQEESGAKLTGQVPITNTLLRHVMDTSKPLHSLHRLEVEKYLSANLKWSITTVCIAPPLRITRTYGSQIRGRTVPLDSMPSLTVSVAVGSAAHHHHADILSDYSAYEALHLGTQRASVAHAASSTSTSSSTCFSASIHHDQLATTAYACSDPRSESSPPFHAPLDGANLRSYPICCR